jgi:hypothetical protein
VVRVVALAALLPVATLLNAPAALASISSPDAPGVAVALKSDATATTGASWVTVPATVGNVAPNGISEAPVAGFPTNGSTFAILTTGNVNDARRRTTTREPARTCTDLHGPARTCTASLSTATVAST